VDRAVANGCDESEGQGAFLDGVARPAAGHCELFDLLGIILKARHVDSYMIVSLSECIRRYVKGVRYVQTEAALLYIVRLPY
jgi:hypothetical protein